MIDVGRSPFLKRALIRRVLACLLLLPMIYATTFGSAHSHTSLSGSVADGFASSYESGTILAGPLQKPVQGDECLLCVFHKQLFSTTIPEAIFAAKPEAQIVSSPAPTVLFYAGRITSAPLARLSGRAPPRG